MRGCWRDDRDNVLTHSQASWPCAHTRKQSVTAATPCTDANNKFKIIPAHAVTPWENVRRAYINGRLPTEDTDDRLVYDPIGYDSEGEGVEDRQNGFKYVTHYLRKVPRK
jgi:hypothetical protein